MRTTLSELPVDALLQVEVKVMSLTFVTVFPSVRLESLQAQRVDPLHHSSSCAPLASSKYLKEVSRPSACNRYSHLLPQWSRQKMCWHEDVSYTKCSSCSLNEERDAQGTLSNDLNPKNATPRRDLFGHDSKDVVDCH